MTKPTPLATLQAERDKASTELGELRSDYGRLEHRMDLARERLAALDFAIFALTEGEKPAPATPRQARGSVEKAIRAALGTGLNARTMNAEEIVQAAGGLKLDSVKTALRRMQNSQTILHDGERYRLPPAEHNGGVLR